MYKLSFPFPTVGFLVRSGHSLISIVHNSIFLNTRYTEALTLVLCRRAELFEDMRLKVRFFFFFFVFFFLFLVWALEFFFFN
jgi:hypothetical protein